MKLQLGLEWLVGFVLALAFPVVGYFFRRLNADIEKVDGRVDKANSRVDNTNLRIEEAEDACAGHRHALRNEVHALVTKESLAHTEALRNLEERTDTQIERVISLTNQHHAETKDDLRSLKDDLRMLLVSNMTGEKRRELS